MWATNHGHLCKIFFRYNCGAHPQYRFFLFFLFLIGSLFLIFQQLTQSFSSNQHELAVLQPSLVQSHVLFFCMLDHRLWIFVTYWYSCIMNFNTQNILFVFSDNISWLLWARICSTIAEFCVLNSWQNINHSFGHAVYMYTLVFLQTFL